MNWNGLLQLNQEPTRKVTNEYVVFPPKPPLTIMQVQEVFRVTDGLDVPIKRKEKLSNCWLSDEPVSSFE